MMVAKQKNSSIQALRAVAAMIVFLSHSLMMIKSDTILLLHDTPLHFLFDGQCAVIFFMVLSGFFYYKVEAFALKRYPHGLWKKIVRIYPLHIIMICLGVILCNQQLSYDRSLFSTWGNTFWTRSVSLTEAVRQMIIILPGTDPNLVNPPIWYLSAEVRMFIVMPLLVGLLNKLGEAEDSILYWVAWISMCIVSGIIYPFALCYLIGYLTAHVLNKYRNDLDRDLSPILMGGGVLLPRSC